MKYLFTLLIFFAIATCFGQTSGNMTFTVNTVNYSAPYSPRHILAIWIADGSGIWIKTRKRIYQNTAYRQYLTNFKNATGGTYNATDATTGATLQAHTTHTVSWDGKDVNGNLVADGTYRVYVEFTSANATGKLYYCEFTKGTDAVTLTPANLTYFQNINLTWTPESTSANDLETVTSKQMCFPNPFTDLMVINSGRDQVNIYNIAGKRVRSFSSGQSSRFTWDGKDEAGIMLPSGLYLVSFGDGRKVVKVVKK